MKTKSSPSKELINLNDEIMSAEIDSMKARAGMYREIAALARHANEVLDILLQEHLEKGKKR